MINSNKDNNFKYFKNVHLIVYFNCLIIKLENEVLFSSLFEVSVLRI